MRPLAEALAARGFAVRVPRLAGHGTDVADLARTDWSDWFRSATTGFDALAAEVPRVAVAGLSMGSLLALHLAATRPEVAALVSAATPITLADWRIRLIPLAAQIPAVRRRLALIPKRGGPDVSDPAVRAASPSYRSTPLVAVQEMLRLRATVMRELAYVTQPALLLQGRNDHTVRASSVRALRRRLGSRVVETHVLERSWHVLTVDVERDEVGRLAGDFLERVESGAVA
jgi:carboxylesterase